MTVIESRREVRQLTLQWLDARLPPSRVSFDQGCQAINALLISTDNLDTTRWVLDSLLRQAVAQGLRSEWVHTELAFETTVARVGDRGVVCALYLTHEGQGDDTSLDRYLERLKRFT